MEMAFSPVLQTYFTFLVLEKPLIFLVPITDLISFLTSVHFPTKYCRPELNFASPFCVWVSAVNCQICANVERIYPQEKGHRVLVS